MKIFLKIVASVFGLFIVGFGIFMFLRPSQPGNRPLVVGMMSGWAPFMVINDQGLYEGFDVDVAQELGKCLGRPVKIQDIGSLAALLLALEQGKVDIAMSGLDITEVRSQKLLMVPYTGTAVTTFCLLFKDEVPQGITTMDDLKNLNEPIICVEPGSSQEKFLDQFSWVTCKALGKIEEMVLDVQYKKSLAMLVESQVARRVMRYNNQLKSLSIALPKSFQTFGMGIALTPANKILSLSVETALKQMRSNGTLGLLEKKWNLEEGA